MLGYPPRQFRCAACVVAPVSAFQDVDPGSFHQIIPCVCLPPHLSPRAESRGDASPPFETCFDFAQHDGAVSCSSRASTSLGTTTQFHVRIVPRLRPARRAEDARVFWVTISASVSTSSRHVPLNQHQFRDSRDEVLCSSFLEQQPKSLFPGFAHVDR